MRPDVSQRVPDASGRTCPVPMRDTSPDTIGGVVLVSGHDGRCPTTRPGYRCDLRSGHAGECETRETGADWVGPAPSARRHSGMGPNPRRAS